MNNVNENQETKVKIIKNFIKDLSFENPQNIFDNNAYNNDNCNIDLNVNVIFNPYEKDFFSLILKITLDSSSKENNKKLFNLELDYFGFFKSLQNFKDDQKTLTNHGLKLIYPFAKQIIQDITEKGGSVSVSLENMDFNLIKN